jgi:hypothetical protein
MDARRLDQDRRGKYSCDQCTDKIISYDSFHQIICHKFIVLLHQETERTTAEVALPPQVNCSDEEDSSTSDDDDDLFQLTSLNEDTPTKDE